MKKILFSLVCFTAIGCYADSGVTSFSNANIGQYLDKHDQSIINNTNVFDGQDITSQESKEQAMQPKVSPVQNNGSSNNVVVVEQSAANSSGYNQNYNNEAYGYYYPEYYTPYSYNNNDYVNNRTYSRLQSQSIAHYDETHGGDYVSGVGTGASRIGGGVE